MNQEELRRQGNVRSKETDEHRIKIIKENKSIYINVRNQEKWRRRTSRF